MENRTLTYAQAEQAFADLERRRKDGLVNEADYRQELNTLRVLDEHGRTWMLQETTGQWFVYHNQAWVASTPPGREAAAAQPVSPPAKARPQAVTRPPQARRAPRAAPRPKAQRMGCMGVTMRIILWDMVWIGVAAGVYSFFGQRMPWLFIPVALLAAATLVLWLRRLGRRASGGA
jgi:hypothetical protein